MIIRIALHGYARTGKDEIGIRLQNRLGLVRVAFGDIIKLQVDPICKRYLGFSAFTTDRTQKAQIREFLVHWGYANYQNILDELMKKLPGRCINTRIFALEEAVEWTNKGGVIVEVKRPGVRAAEPMEKLELKRCRERNLIKYVINNNGSLEDLDRKVGRLIEQLGYRSIDRGAQQKQGRVRRARVGSLPH